MAHSISAHERQKKARSAISLWLFIMCALVALTVIVGGATRLTDSGLSITEWKPVTGAVPPLDEASWLAEFEKYKAIPEYQLVNRGMTLGDFKKIYWWEWAHRFLGRLLGVAFLAPLIYFAVARKLSRSLGLKLFALFILGGAQGALGWYMVKSGLSDRIDVSQYRLAAHMALAVLLFALMFWLALDLRNPRARTTPLSYGALALAAAVYAQMILGAFVAGLRAGRSYNSWPLMDGRFFPRGYFEGSPGVADLFESVAAVQFNHRLGAYLLAAGVIWFFIASRRTAVARRASSVLIIFLMQFAVGVWTVLAAAPLSLGLIHQAGALALLACVLYAAHGTGGPTSKLNPSAAG